MSDNSAELFPDLTNPGIGIRSTGLLPSQFIAAYCKLGHICSEEALLTNQIQPASIDLRLGAMGYRVKASFLPDSDHDVESTLDRYALSSLDLNEPQLLRRGYVYLFPLMESLRLPPDISGKANAKSSIGRVDVFSRLITEDNPEFDRIPPGYRGRLFVEVMPRTFDVLVRKGTKLNQLRLMRGFPEASDTSLSLQHERDAIVYTGDSGPGMAVISDGLWLTVNLNSAEKDALVGYKARNGTPPVDLDKKDHYLPQDFWDKIVLAETKELMLEPDAFYILSSRERISVRPDQAAEMMPYDASVGEFRVHYAGFFDPGFGYGRGDRKGTPAVLEVRAHGVPFILTDGQTIGRLRFERLRGVPDRIYGKSIDSSYQFQSIALSNHFRKNS